MYSIKMHPIVVSLAVILPTVILAQSGTVWQINPYENEDDTTQYLSSESYVFPESSQAVFIGGRESVKTDSERLKRSLKYHVLESPGLKTHFEIDPSMYDLENEKNSKKQIKKHGEVKERHVRSIENMDIEDDMKAEESNAEEIVEKLPTAEKYTNYEESKSDAMDEADKLMNSAREARGATKEQWIKQPYPIDFSSMKDSSHKDDQHSSSSNNDDLNIRAPRVSFVTQKRLDQAESRDRPEVKSRLSTDSPPTRNGYEKRDFSRARSLEPLDFRRPYESQRREYGREIGGFNRYDYGQPRYNRYDDQDYGRDFKKKQKRIIYYATLPDVARSPPIVDLRYRSRYPDYDLDYYHRHDRRLYDDRERRLDLPPTYYPQYYRRYPPVPYDYYRGDRPYDVVRDLPPPHDRMTGPFRDTVDRREPERKVPFPVRVPEDPVKDNKKAPEGRSYGEREYVFGPAPSYRSRY